jgi:hypothetical protein
MRCSDVIGLASMTKVGGGGVEVEGSFLPAHIFFCKKMVFFFPMTYDFIIVSSAVPWNSSVFYYVMLCRTSLSNYLLALTRYEGHHDF